MAAVGSGERLDPWINHPRENWTMTRRNNVKIVKDDLQIYIIAGIYFKESSLIRHTSRSILLYSFFSTQHVHRILRSLEKRCSLSSLLSLWRDNAFTQQSRHDIRLQIIFGSFILFGIS